LTRKWRIWYIKAIKLVPARLRIWSLRSSGRYNSFSLSVVEESRYAVRGTESHTVTVCFAVPIYAFPLMAHRALRKEGGTADAYMGIVVKTEEQA
jgi:hypothetical protein